jgi:hypothetical protein
MKDIRDATLSGLGDIPVLLSGAQRVLGIYGSSQRLANLSDALYTATLTSLGHLLHYLGRKSAVRALEAVFRQSSFQKDLMGSLGDLRKCRDSFNEEARICEMEMQRMCRSMLQATGSDTKDIQENLARMQYFMVLTHDENLRAQEFLREEALWAHENMMRIEEDQEALKYTLNEVFEFFKSSPFALREAQGRSKYRSVVSSSPISNRSLYRSTTRRGAFPCYMLCHQCASNTNF